MKERRKVMIVCSQPGILDLARRRFARLTYQVRTAKTSAEALRVLRVDNKIGAVVVDHRMPQMNGVKLLSDIRNRYAAIMRILLVDRSDMDSVIGAINDAGVQKLLVKPWNHDRLIKAVDDVFQYRELARENERLSKQLRAANDELTEMNRELEQRVQQKASELAHAVYYDALTGLPSRQLARELINKSIESAKRDRSAINVFVIGLDRFKFINESLGHGAGDEVLKEVAARLLQLFRSNDIVTRLGADVFAVALTNGGLYEDMGHVAQRVLDTIAEPLQVGGQDLFLTGSIGISQYPNDGADAENLMEHAETAMRQVKVKDRNTYGSYSGVYNQIAGARLSLEAELRRAVEHEEFILYYQPRVDVDTGRVVGAEALLRWQHPGKGIVLPLNFLPLLEDTGLIKPVGQLVLQQACAALGRWQAKNIGHLQLAINLSAKQFYDRNLADNVYRVASQAGVNLARGNLELEITESLVMEDVLKTRKILQSLHEMGVAIAIDDFGTGYSSLSYLIQFPLDYLKIDKSFVDNLEKSNDAKAIVEALVSLSYSLRLKAIAEGVENVNQLTILRALGCKQYQGYLFSRPIPEAEFLAIMESNNGAGLIHTAYQDNLTDRDKGQQPAVFLPLPKNIIQ
jgi:diguanylate cyclase (GGDEF)-like protein